MNQNNLLKIFQHYIDKFGYINDDTNMEYYKWQVCREFPGLMKKALEADDDVFYKALNEAKKSTFNLIDSYTQPFGGLVEFAKSEPAKVKKMLMDLYSDDGGDIRVQKEIVSDFFVRSNELLDKLFPDSFRYKQNSHSVSALLFLNDPDHHYMYKADQSLKFADCIEFYDDWGTGDNIKLEIYYRMCDELVSEIKGCEALLETDGGRFDGRLDMKGKELHPDNEKHILAFDIIYCCSVYDLFDGISFSRPRSKERLLIKEYKEKALMYSEKIQKAKEEAERLNEAAEFVDKVFAAGNTVHHAAFGDGKIRANNGSVLTIDFPDAGEKKFGSILSAANGILTISDKEQAEKINGYRDILKREKSIRSALLSAEKDFAPYSEYLD